VVAGFTCLRGHLTSAGHTGPGSVYQPGQFCKPGSEPLYNSFHLTCANGKLVRK
jgi:hypothetical protein